MTVKFEFELSDKDASNLIDILQSEQTRALARVREFNELQPTRANQVNADWYNGHAEYLEGLKQKILAGSSRAQEHPCIEMT